VKERYDAVIIAAECTKEGGFVAMRRIHRDPGQKPWLNILQTANEGPDARILKLLPERGPLQ